MALRGRPSAAVEDLRGEIGRPRANLPSNSLPEKELRLPSLTWYVYPLSHDAPAFALHGVDLTRGHTADLSAVWTAMGGNCRSSCEPARSSVFEIGALGCPKLLRGNASLDDQK